MVYIAFIIIMKRRYFRTKAVNPKIQYKQDIGFISHFSVLDMNEWLQTGFRIVKGYQDIRSQISGQGSDRTR